MEGFPPTPQIDDMVQSLREYDGPVQTLQVLKNISGIFKLCLRTTIGSATLFVSCHEMFLALTNIQRSSIPK